MSESQPDLDDFRGELKGWLEENLPVSMRPVAPGEAQPEVSGEDRQRWKQAAVARGYTVPTWPREYGGGGLSKQEARILREELAVFGAYAPPVSFFGTAMLGPVLLEFATHEQKLEHMAKICSGEINWCQGYSEPGAGSDLAGLQTRAVRDGDHYIINGSKIWTTQADKADWIFCLVRTDPEAAKHDGISFILFDLKSPGVTISPIRLISGESDFCQVFFENVRADARNLVGPLNGGWTIAKRLLEHERNTLSGSMGGGGAPIPAAGKKPRKKKAASSQPKSFMAEGARKCLGDDSGRLSDPLLRDRIAQWELDSLCLGLSMRRSGESARSGHGSGPATSMFKFYASELNKRRCELQISLLGARGLGWEGDGFSPGELLETRGWLRSKGNSIEGGTSEVQLNIIAKRVLGLPD